MLKEEYNIKTVFVAINAKYSHTNIAVRYMQKLAEDNGIDTTSFVEYTINQRTPQLMSELYRLNVDCLIFSCYIWNIEIITELCMHLKMVSPNTKLVLAGPEVSYDSAEVLKKDEFIDGVICGEGELVLLPLLNWIAGEGSVEDIPSFVYRQDGKIFANKHAESADLAILPFPYENLDEVMGRTLYFEASRGCPFSCGYCLSSIEKGVRFMPLQQVFKSMDKFIAANVRQVKFVDRTFNCNKEYALAIWHYLSEHDNGVTNFHFEIAGELLDEPTIAFLSTVRKGLFQFEVGVQSTNPKTLDGITRKTNISSLLAICQKLNEPANIHLHLDLIAGLPYEDIASFANSFNDVFAAEPQQLQLGFLKVLKGSAIHSNSSEMGIVYSPKAPYEVLSTDWLPYSDLLSLKATEEMVELYYNSGRFENILKALLPYFKTPYSFFQRLGEFYVKQGWHITNHTKEQTYSILKDFCTDQKITFTEHMEY
ncbi:MAG: DUF4080 domain-containing protein, partial [Oscillospiraceae bacterium]